ncbi:putative transposase protein [Cucumis melo var. makuwa]|uniref:Putative transposase protein n=1 Tax=Cucumis melo var. makuwa TaxID=1194695 RepID=A0A5D3CIY6_CUCMM|nr:putative transposase protein [Cucumis melo var. makuwa]
MEKRRLEDEMLRNIGEDIDEDTTNILLSLVHFMKPNENFVTWIWDMRLFTRASTDVYCTGKSLLICNIAYMWRGSIQDDVLRHPADVEGWKHVDSEFSDFASDPQNVRLRLASDGFNPFGQMSTSYSMWLIMLL